MTQNNEIIDNPLNKEGDRVMEFIEQISNIMSNVIFTYTADFSSILLQLKGFVFVDGTCIFEKEIRENPKGKKLLIEKKVDIENKYKKTIPYINIFVQKAVTINEIWMIKRDTIPYFAQIIAEKMEEEFNKGVEESMLKFKKYNEKLN